MQKIPPAIQWMGEKQAVGHVFWPVFFVSALVGIYAVARAFAAYGDLPAIRHPVAFLFSLAVILLLPAFMAVGYYIFWRLWRPRADVLRRQAEDIGDAENDQPAMGKAAFFCLVAALGFMPLLLFIGLLAVLDVAGIDLRNDGTRHMLVAGLMAAALLVERWARVGGVLLWGGVYVHLHLADDSLSRWLLLDSGIL